MMRLLLLLIFLLLPLAVSAQETAKERQGVIWRLRAKIKEFTNKAQSISADSSSLNISNPTDSLQIKKRLPAIATKPDSLGQKIRRIETPERDSLISFDPNQKINRMANGISAKGDSLSGMLEAPLHKVNDEVREKTEKLNESISQSQIKISEFENKGASLVSKATGGEMSINAQLPGNSNPLNSIEGAGINIPEGVDIPESSNLSLPVIEGQKLPDIPNAELPDLSIELPKENLSLDNLEEKVNLDIPNQEKLSNISEQINGIDSKFGDAAEYGEQLKTLKEGDVSSVDKLSENLEQKAASISGMNEMTDKVKALTQQEQERLKLIERYKDKKKLQEEIIAKAKNVVNDKFNKFSPEVAAAQKQIAKAQRLKSGVLGIRNYVDFKKPNAMKDKPFYERFVPGISFSSYSQDVFKLETGAQIAYKLSGKFTLGLGGVCLLSIDKGNSSYVKSEDIYGVRSFIDVGFFKSIYGHVEFQALHVGVQKNVVTKVEMPGSLSQTFNLGLGRRYAISGKLNGYALALYKISFKGHFPSPTKFDIRIGIDLNTKKREKLPLLD